MALIRVSMVDVPWHLATGRLEESKRLFELVTSRDPDNAIALRGLAEIHRRTGARPRAAEHYRALLRLMPWDLDAQKGLAQVLGSTPTSATPHSPTHGRRVRSLPRELAATIGAQEALAKALIPGSSGLPAIPSTPGRSSAPGQPSTPGTPGTPSTLGAPDQTSTPGTPGTPIAPGTRGAPGKPSTPGTPVMPAVSTVSDPPASMPARAPTSAPARMPTSAPPP